MNINTVIDFLNKEHGYNLSGAYYSHIGEWVDWWKGYHKPFHHFKESAGEKLIDRDMYTLKMAKKVCEDWASLLLNEKTEIVITDNTTKLNESGERLSAGVSSEFVQGEDGTGGVFGVNDFWEQGNISVERAFSSGTAAIILRLDDMNVKDDRVVKDPETAIRLEYLPAGNIIPLTVKQRRIVDVAFVSEAFVRGKDYIYLETHMLESSGYQITNRYFTEENGSLIPADLPEGIAESFNTGSDVPLFAIMAPNITNNIDEGNGLGISVYADAIDNLKGVDLAYNNFNRDLKLGGKKVFMNESLTRRDENGNVITPDDVAQQLFVQVGEEFMAENGSKNLIYEYNPALRTAENKDAVQAQLDYLSFKVGFGTKHYQFNAGSIVTATQYMGDKQELTQNASKHYIIIERALKQLVRAILWAGREILGQPVDPDAQITVNFEDSYIIDKESERERDRQDVRDGFMQKWEYRAKWFGEDEETAKRMVGADLTDDELMGFGGGK